MSELESEALALERQLASCATKCSSGQWRTSQSLFFSSNKTIQVMSSTVTCNSRLLIPRWLTTLHLSKLSKRTLTNQWYSRQSRISLHKTHCCCRWLASSTGLGSNEIPECFIGGTRVSRKMKDRHCLIQPPGSRGRWIEESGGRESSFLN